MSSQVSSSSVAAPVLGAFLRARLRPSPGAPPAPAPFRARVRSLTAQIDAACVRGNVLDLGDGDGLLLPALDRRFRTVTCLDTQVSGAARVTASLGLRRVDLCAGSLDCLNGTRYDAIVALEPRFGADPRARIGAIAAHLRPGGWLFTVLPTRHALASRVAGPAAAPAHDLQHALVAHGFTLMERRILRCISMLPRWSVQTLRLSARP
jgi:hypothetical protein